MDERLNAQMTGELHFGGGFVRKEVPTQAPDGAGVDEPEHRRTKKEVGTHSFTLHMVPCTWYPAQHTVCLKGICTDIQV